MSEMTISKERLEALEAAAATLAETKKKQKDQWQRRNAKLMIFKLKAEEAGIKVTDAEIDEYLNK